MLTTLFQSVFLIYVIIEIYIYCYINFLLEEANNLSYCNVTSIISNLRANREEKFLKKVQCIFGKCIATNVFLSYPLLLKKNNKSNSII